MAQKLSSEIHNDFVRLGACLPGFRHHDFVTGV